MRYKLLWRDEADSEELIILHLRICESGGIGRRTGFRFQRRKVWGFESPLSHQMDLLKETACKQIWRI